MLPTLATERACRRIATGETIAKRTLGAANNAIAARSGSALGPGSQSTIACSTGSSTSGIASTETAPAPIAANSSKCDG